MHYVHSWLSENNLKTVFLAWNWLLAVTSEGCFLHLPRSILFAHVFKCLASDFVSRRFAWWCSLEFLFNWPWDLLLPTWSATPSTLEQLPVYFYLITGLIQVDVSIGQFTLSMHYTGFLENFAIIRRTIHCWFAVQFCFSGCLTRREINAATICIVLFKSAQLS